MGFLMARRLKDRVHQEMMQKGYYELEKAEWFDKWVDVGIHVVVRIGRGLKRIYTRPREAWDYFGNYFNQSSRF
tara:strand:- start:134 stop:355 length:222 start_codon:yes stop_codon:yes gene_type:complete